jgi:hypothetical protein
MPSWEDVIKSIAEYNQQKPFTAAPSDLEQAKKELEDKFTKSKTKRYKANTKLRRQLAEWATAVVSVWLFLVLTILSLNDGRLSDNVLMTLLGTTTLNVLGLMAIVLRGLFDKDENPK